MTQFQGIVVNGANSCTTSEIRIAIMLGPEVRLQVKVPEFISALDRSG
jgi:hypothetical protein